MKAISILILLFSMAIASYGIEQDPVNRRGYDQEELSSLNKSDRYDYDRIEEEEEAITSREPNFILKLLNFLTGLFSSVFGFIVIGVLLVLLILLILKNSDRLFKHNRVDYSERVVIKEVENIAEVDYSKLIDLALQDKNYSLAVRYKFLECLKFLQRSGHIKWHREKTNFEYLDEVPESHYEMLGKCIVLYERVWYGKFEATEATYLQLHNTSNQLNSLR